MSSFPAPAAAALKSAFAASVTRCRSSRWRNACKATARRHEISGMTNDFWNSRFSEPGYAYGTEPNAFLVSQKHYLMPGLRVLAVGDGEGRNGVWLAQQGLDVLSVDGSKVGLRKAREFAKSRGVSIGTELADLTKLKK